MRRQIHGPSRRESGDHERVTETGARAKMGTNERTIPGWVQALEPVRKLPTKNGSRIRRCIYDALDKGPPTWAKNRLEYSISKAVYKANASGPTKLWHNIRIGQTEQPDLIQLVDILSQHFESLYEKEVLDNVRKLREYSESDSVSAEADCEVGNILILTSEMPEAIWNSGLCKVCNTDKDDGSVLLCDICDGEYHTYCLRPPLGKLPEGKWYCPSCMSPENVAKATSNVSELLKAQKCKEHYGSHQSEKLRCMGGGLRGDGSGTSEDVDFICEVCSHKGFREAIVDCYKCQDAYVHRYCFYDESKIWVEDVLWACGDCEPFNPDEHLPEEEQPTFYQAAKAEQSVTQKLRQKEDHLEKQNDGNKGGSSANFAPVDSPTGGTEPGQSFSIQKKKGKEVVKKTQTQAGSKK